MKFKSDIEVQAGLRDGSNDIGTAGQLLSSTGTITNWIDQGDVVTGEADKAKSVILRVKNSTASPMTKGQVICEAVSASPPSGNLIEVALADNNGTNTMPALGILNEDLDAAGGNNDEGDAIMFGKVSGIDTSAFSVGDEVFVSDVPGGLTTTKPTGVKYIQKVGVVIRDDNNNGTIEVFGAGRVNDVPTPLYVDHANQRLGVGAIIPNSTLQVDGEIDANGGDGYRIEGKPWANWGSNLLKLGDWDGEGFSTSIFDENSIKTFEVKDQGVKINCDRTSATTYGSNASLVVGGNKSSPWGPGVLTLLNNDTNSLAGDSTGLIQFAIRDDQNISGYTSASIKGSINAAAGSGSSGGGILDFLTSSGGLGASPALRMRINQLGNVGISTTGPRTKLHVSGLTSDDDPSLGSSTAPLFVSNTANSYGLNIGVNIVGTSWLQSQSNTSATAYEMSLNPLGGNVGIGTTSPAQKLTIGGIGETNTDGLKIEDPSNTAYGAHYSYNDTSTTVEIGGVTNNVLNDCISIAREATRTITINTSEQVGIGTTDPRAKLHVFGTTSSTPALGAVASAAQIGGVSFGTLFSTLTSGKGIIQQGKSDGTPTAYDLSLQPVGGDVGIGTTGPRAKLHVNGGVKLGNDTDSPSAAKAGTFRYYTSGNNSYVDMCMQTGASTYAWVNIVTNSW
ncbi:MAG: hypothetical protein GY787_13170 [Alteromonadales bacterium]|nr:hypothetical protein [Alteromonadales bacterium]